MSVQEVQSLKLSLGVRDPSKDYNVIFGGYGSGLSPPDEEDYAYLVGSVVIDYARLGVPMPSSRRLDLEPYFPPIGDQGVQGSCTAWASVYYANTYLQASLHGWNDVKTNPAHVMSPAWTYNKINGGVDQGSWCDKNMRLVTEIGSASMATMPYNQYDYLSWGGEQAWREAPLYRAGGFGTVRPDNIDAIKALLNDGCLVTFYIDSGCVWYQTSDRILSYNEYTGGRPNHANVIVGYDDSITDGNDTGAFRVANSRGTGFKDGGFYWITYNSMSKIAYFSPIANYYLPKSTSAYSPSVLFTWKLSPADSIEGAQVVVGIGDPQSPIATKTPSDCWVAGPSSKISAFMCIDMTEFKEYIDAGVDEFFLKIGNGVSSGIITSFTVEIYNDYPSNPSKIYSSREVPSWTPATVKINDKTLAIFSWAPKSPFTFDTVEFSDLSSSYYGTIVSWNWSFGDGSYSESQNPSHAYSSHGEFTVTLTVLDNMGESSSRSQTIVVKNRPPTVEILQPSGGGLYCNFVDLVANASDQDDGVVAVKFFYSVNNQTYLIGVNDSGPKEGIWTFLWDTYALTLSNVQVFAVAFDGYLYSPNAYLSTPLNLDNTPPESPVIVNPRSGLRTDAEVAFSWLPSSDLGSGVLKYLLEISASPEFESCARIIEISEASCKETLPAGIWYWRIRAIDLAGNAGDWSEPRFLIADSFFVNESGSSRSRADLSTEQLVWFKVVYKYDGSLFTPNNGTVYVGGLPADWNEVLQRWEFRVLESTVGEYAYAISAIIDNDDPIATIEYAVPAPSLVFDRIIIDAIEPDELRVGIGRCANLSVYGHYEYDQGVWVGKPIFNDTLCKDSVGRHCYSVTEVTDDLHNLTAFIQSAPLPNVIFDNILVRKTMDTASLGRCLVRIDLSYEYDGSAITGAEVSINGYPAIEKGNGTYEANIDTFLPYAHFTAAVSLPGFDELTFDEGAFLVGNLLVLMLVSVAAATSLFLIRQIKRKCKTSGIS